MRIVFVLLLNCFGLFAMGADSPMPAQPVIPDLRRAIELEEVGDIKGAERLLFDVIRRSERSGNQGELGVAMNNLAVLYAGTERPADAERYFLRAIRVLETVNDASAAHAVAKTKLHLASLYIESGRAREAARLKIPAVFNQLEGPDDQARARAMLGSLALSENDLPRAEEMFLGVLSYWQSNSTQSKAYMEIATALNNLGIVAWRQGRNDLALSRLMESLNVWKTALGPDNVTLAKAMNNLAVVYAEAKRYGEAVEWQAQATTVAQRVFGDVHPFTITMQTFYAEALKKAGRKAEASQIARAAAESRKIVRRTSVADYTLDYRDVKGRSK